MQAEHASSVEKLRVMDLELEAKYPKLQERLNFKPTEKHKGLNSTGISIDNVNQLLGLVFSSQTHVILFSDILVSEIFIDDTTIVKADFGSLIGRAAIGGLLFGGLGAVFGGVTGLKSHVRDVKKVELKILTKDSIASSYRVCFFQKNSWNSPTPESAVNFASIGTREFVSTVRLVKTIFLNPLASIESL